MKMKIFPNKTFIIAEVGLNHMGNFKLAKKYISEFNKFLNSKIKFSKNTKILDIGCGRANIISALQKSYKFKVKPIGLDIVKNNGIRKKLIQVSDENHFVSIFPDLKLCGDNAAMIAMVGLEKFKLNQFNDLDYPAKPRWPLDEKANFLKGAGVKL